MLQFIVLGLIPGTHFQLTFGWMVAFVVTIVIIAFYVTDVVIRLRQTRSSQPQKSHETPMQLSFPV